MNSDYYKLHTFYKKNLLEDIVPYWIKYACGSNDGSINNCLDDEGNILSKNKFLWSQGRALWTFSALYNEIEDKKLWLDIADKIFNYLCNNGRDKYGRWMYLLDKDGKVVEKDISIYVDGFILNGLSEYYKATGNSTAKQIACETFENILHRLHMPGSYGVAPYEILVGTKTHGINMIFSYFFYNFGEVLGRRDICDIGVNMAKEIITDFYCAKKDAVLEFVTLDGKSIDSPLGRVCVPGHVIEGMWFLISIFERENDTLLIDKCCNIIKRHLELGWDSEYGGIRLAIDIDGMPNVAWNKHECKAWWVHVEGLVATAYAFLHTNDEVFMEWHEKIKDYAYSHFPVKTGEWTQWLDRYGNNADTAALPVKDPFHLPRGLIMLTKILDRAK